jgi:hypothetical protein
VEYLIIKFYIRHKYTMMIRNNFVEIRSYRRKAMANYPQELAREAVCQSHTGHMTGLWFLPALPLRLNTNKI